MKLRTRVVLQLTTLCFVLAAYGFAADNAYLYIVQGIPGRDIAADLSPGFPVDVLINGDTCLLRNLAFGSVIGPDSFPAGTYDVVISEANTLAPCTNSPIIDSQVTVTAGSSASAVIAISGGQPTLLRFNEGLSPITDGNARFVFANAADAPTLQATLTQVGVAKPKKFIVTAAPGKEAAIIVPRGPYSVEVAASGSTTVLASEEIGLPNRSATFTYAAGEAANNSLDLINRNVPEVF